MHAGTNAQNGVSTTESDYVPEEGATEQSSTIETSAIQWHWMGGGTRTDLYCGYSMWKKLRGRLIAGLPQDIL